MSLAPAEQDNLYSRFWNPIEEFTKYDPSSFVRDYLTMKQGKILEDSVVTILICRCQCGFGNRLASYAKKLTLGMISLQSYHNVSQTFTI